MAWPTEAGAINRITWPVNPPQLRGRPGRLRRFGPPSKPILPAPPAAAGQRGHFLVRTVKPRRRRPRTHVFQAPTMIAINRYYVDLRENYRIFNAAVYRFYKSTTGPPLETDTPFATNATLPHSPADLFTADGVVYFSLSYFNGVLDSGFLPIGPNGETYLRLDLTGGAQVSGPPRAPQDVRLILRADGVVRVQAVYTETGALRAGEWAITYTTNGATPGTPPAVAPTVTQAIAGTNVSVLEYDLPAQANGTTVKVRVQVRRDDSGTWRYSEGSTVLTAIADAAGPAAVEGVGVWRGAAPQEL